MKANCIQTKIIESIESKVHSNKANSIQIKLIESNENNAHLSKAK